MPDWKKDPKTGKPLRWRGGRIAESPDGDVYYIECMREGARYSHCLGPIGLPDAQTELSRFNDDPAKYLPPEGRVERDRREAAEAARAYAAGAVFVDSALIDRAKAAIRAGYGTRQAVSEKQAKDFDRYLTQWAQSPALLNRDLREVKAVDLAEQLARWDTAKRNRINNWNTFVRWLHRGAKKITPQVFQELHLESVAPRKPTRKELREKVYDPEHVAAIYAHIPSPPAGRPGAARSDPQVVRDVLRVRTMTGMHITEVQRIAKGEGTLERNPHGGAIAGKVTFPHKSGHEHAQCVDAPTFAALERLAKVGAIPDYWDLDREIEWAARACGKDPIQMGNLRATFVTLARTKGALENVPGQSGIPRALVAQIVGHTNDKTTETFYDASEWPPMAVIPMKLVHRDDPPLASESKPAHSRAA